MSRDLRAPKRPHFMDNTYTPVDKTYVSKKILGQLYDQVERIDFVPMFAAPFDDRILKAYDVGEALLDEIREIKKRYDAHMHRIMAQHDIKTEFEVWSTFVLQHDRTTNDFKFHEQISQLSNALKEQFKALCHERAGGKDFQRLGPFVAAMYKITAMEIGEAVEECGQFEDIGGRRKPLRTMTPEKMPLMSFPWLFADVLGKIAKNTDREAKGITTVEHEAAELQKDVLRSGQLRKSRVTSNLMNTNDDLQTTAGVTHRGEVLELFDHPNRLNDSAKDGNEGGTLSPATNTESLESSGNNEAPMSPAFSVHKLVDITPSGSFEDGDDIRSMSFSSHSSDLASLNQGLYDEKDGELQESDPGISRRFFSNASDESDGADDFEDALYGGKSPDEAADVYNAVETALAAGTVKDEIEMKKEEQESVNIAVKKGEGEEKEKAIGEGASDDSEDEDEVLINLDTRTGLFNRLAQLGTVEHPNPALYIAEAKANDSPISCGDHGLKDEDRSNSESIPEHPQRSTKDGKDIEGIVTNETHNNNNNNNNSITPK